MQTLTLTKNFLEISVMLHMHVLRPLIFLAADIIFSEEVTLVGDIDGQPGFGQLERKMNVHP